MFVRACVCVFVCGLIAYYSQLCVLETEVDRERELYVSACGLRLAFSFHPVALTAPLLLTRNDASEQRCSSVLTEEQLLPSVSSMPHSTAHLGANLFVREYKYDN